MKNLSNNLIEEFFKRGVDKFVDPGGVFKEKLSKKIEGNYPKDIVIKLGADPTRPDIHLGHAVILRKLRQLQDWGCKVVFLIGDFTARIGDPTGRDKGRPEMEQQEIDKNMKTYIEQVGKILKTDTDSFSWIRNSDWFTSITDLNLPPDYKVNLQIKHPEGKEMTIPINPNSSIGKAVIFERTRMQGAINKQGQISTITLLSFLQGLKSVTFNKLIERDMFQERLKKGKELFMHELLYPVFQGMDSQILAKVYGSCDLEVGGSDQLFNMLMGRDIMKNAKLEPQSVLSFSLLEGTNGKEKMSKSLDNYIAINDSPDQMFGKVMSINDSLIPTYFTLCTYSPLEEVEKIKKLLKSTKTNPKDLKVRLAEEIVAIYHGEEEAKNAKNSFLEVFKEKGIPRDIESVEVNKGDLLADILSNANLIKSKTEFRRLVSSGAIEDVLNSEKIDDAQFSVSRESIFKIGKKRFLKVLVK